MLGIFGGTFDPIHYGHLRSGLEALEELALEQIRFIPLKESPHGKSPVVTAQGRLGMVKAAVAGVPRLVVDDREMKREGKSYTCDTLRSLREEFPEKKLLLMLGSDAFKSFAQWRKPNEILAMAHVLVMQRPGEAFVNVYPERRVASLQELGNQANGCVLFKTFQQMDISSTALRKSLQQKKSVRDSIPDVVVSMIQQHGYYK